MENTNENVKKFIPEENSSAYTNYKVRLFSIVPPNAVLVTHNIFTGKVKVKERGLRFNFPWIRSKLVITSTVAIDYPKRKYVTSDNVYIDVDPALTVKVIDASKYEFNSTNPLEELGTKIEDVMRIFIANKSVKDMIGKKYNLVEIDSQGLLADFALRNGLQVTNLYFKSTDLPKTLVDDFEAATQQRLANERAIERAKSLKEQAIINKETAKLNAEAAAYGEKTRLTAIAKVLKDMNITPTEFAKVVSDSMWSNGNATVINKPKRNTKTKTSEQPTVKDLAENNNVDSVNSSEKNDSESQEVEQPKKRGRKRKVTEPTTDSENK